MTAGRRGAATTRSASEGAPASYVVRRTPVRGPSASCRTGRWRLRRAGGVRGCRLGGQRRRAGGLRLPLSGSAARGGRGRVSRNAPPPMVPVVVRRTRKALYVPPCSLGSRAGCMNPSGVGGGAGHAGRRPSHRRGRGNGRGGSNVGSSAGPRGRNSCRSAAAALILLADEARAYLAPPEAIAQTRTATTHYPAPRSRPRGPRRAAPARPRPRCPPRPRPGTRPAPRRWGGPAGP